MVTLFIVMPAAEGAFVDQSDDRLFDNCKNTREH